MITLEIVSEDRAGGWLRPAMVVMMILPRIVADTGPPALIPAVTGSDREAYVLAKPGAAGDLLIALFVPAQVRRTAVPAIGAEPMA